MTGLEIIQMISAETCVCNESARTASWSEIGRDMAEELHAALDEFQRRS